MTSCSAAAAPPSSAAPQPQAGSSTSAPCPSNCAAGCSSTTAQVTNGNTVVDFGGLAKGAGTYQSVTTINGGRFSPGNSPGRATVGTFFMQPRAGNYDFEINNATGTAGPTGATASAAGT